MASVAVSWRPGPARAGRPFLIVVPLTLAWATQAWATRKRAGQRLSETITVAMVPLMAAALLTVVASQIPTLEGNIATVLTVVPFFILFLAIVAPAGLLTARLFRLDTSSTRALVFSGATRNDLVGSQRTVIFA